jgi:mono/diheme cytochrome c family protein
MRHIGLLVVVVSAVVSIASAGRAAAADARPENLALTAKASASSEYSGDYTAAHAVDGALPAPMCRADVGKAWAMKGPDQPKGVEFSLEWPEPVLLAEIVYYGRTGWEWVENCKDYELRLDGAAAGTPPLVKGQLKCGHGPQRIKLPSPAMAKKVTLKFLSNYGGSNPGASEIQVYSVSPPEAMLGKFLASPPAGAGEPPAAVYREIPESAELAASLKGGRLGFDRMVVIQRRVLNPSHVYTYHVEGFGGGGGLCLLDLAGGEVRKLVDSPSGQIIDLDMSYDGKTVLFSWRRSGATTYQLFTIGVDGSGLRQLTDGASHNYNGCWLPDGGIAFLSTRKSQFAYCWTSPVGILHRIDANDVGNGDRHRSGELRAAAEPVPIPQARQISANYLNDFTPSITNDGRIIYGRWEYVDRPAIPIQSLWTINPDGTGLSVFYGNRVLSPATFMEPRAIPGSSAILCTMTAHNGPCRGAIGVIDPIHGDNAQESIRNLTPEVNIGQVDRGDGNNVRGPYESPYPLDGELFLCSRDGTILLRDYDGTKQVTVLTPRDKIGFYGPQPVRSRPRPPVRATILPPGGAEDHWATVYVQDVYNGLEPVVQRGEVKQIAVVQELEKPRLADVSLRAFGFQFPVVSCGATYAPKKVWGYAAVAEDGSAAFRVPAGAPIYFMALDAQGRAVQRMRSFTHLMGGEVQGCVGCHESRSQNALSHTRPQAFGAKPQDLTPPEWGTVGFSYPHVVQPVLDKHCIRCHNAEDAPKGLDLSGDKTDFFNVSYEYLARQGAPGQNPYTKWIPTFNGMEANILLIAPKYWGSPASKLAQVVLSGHPDKDGVKRVDMDEPSRRRVMAWMDLNVPYYGTSRSTHYDREGCRRMLPPELDKVLQEVASRRCVSCHKADAKGVVRLPRKEWTRVTNPEKNNFLTAPLARKAGGKQTCGQAVFESTADADYQAILKTFVPIAELLRKTPRTDMVTVFTDAEVCP